MYFYDHYFKKQQLKKLQNVRGNTPWYPTASCKIAM